MFMCMHPSEKEVRWRNRNIMRVRDKIKVDVAMLGMSLQTQNTWLLFLFCESRGSLFLTRVYGRATPDPFLFTPLPLPGSHFFSCLAVLAVGSNGVVTPQRWQLGQVCMGWLWQRLTFTLTCTVRNWQCHTWKVVTRSLKYQICNHKCLFNVHFVTVTKWKMICLLKLSKVCAYVHDN